MLHRPLWTEGTLLCPQHLQQQDLYHERLLAARLAATVPHPWGVLAVRFDPAALAVGQLALTHLRAVLPDGTPLDLHEHSPHLPPPRTIAPHLSAARERLAVHLGVPELRPGAVNITADALDPAPHDAAHPHRDSTPDSTAHRTTTRDSNHSATVRDPGRPRESNLADAPPLAPRDPAATPRWRCVTRPIYDLTLAHSARELELLEPQLVLRFTDEPRDELTSLPLAEVIRDPAGGFTLDPTFIPPIASVAASPWLQAGLQDLLALATTRWRALEADRRRQHDLPRALFFHTLGGVVPRLRHLVDLPASSPTLAHQTLAALAGELRGLASVDPATLPAFVFTDLRASLGPLIGELQRRLTELFPDRHLTIPLELRPDGLWLGELRDDRLRAAGFVLAVESDADPATLARDLPALTRIAAWRRISLIVRNNVLGAALRPLAHPPLEIPALPRHTYFSIVPDDPCWLEVLRERNVALYLPPPHDHDHARVSLFAIPRDP
ncbi:MAG: type VI secretion system baseplate subunit TssK [Myxococcales bacterium]|nr:type VI secretion system baseplate subunit TssK [Myxococcales bacterium]